jgi:3-hydroxybutyryl-CoA dehydrogenase
VVEAVVEDLKVKQALFENLDEICKQGAILATTTSSLPVIECAVATKRPQDVVGMHFFNPAQVMRLVEVVHTVSTTDDVVATVQDLCRAIGKHPVTCGDRSGFIVNALLFPYLNDAVKMLEAHYASADDIDTAMKTGCGYPMGPFELLDAVGLDVSLAIQRELYLEFRNAVLPPRRCSSSSSPPAISAARWVAGSAPTPEPGTIGTCPDPIADAMRPPSLI